MGGLAGPVGFDAADRLGGGPPDSSGVLAFQVDGDSFGGDVDSDDVPGVDAAEGELLPGDHDHAGVAGPPLDRHWFGGGPRERRGRAAAAPAAGPDPRSAG